MSRITGVVSVVSQNKEVILFKMVIISRFIIDIDIAIFTGYSIPYDKVELYEEELSRSLESIVKFPIDVKVVDYAPAWFRVKALEGVVLVERQHALAARLRFKAQQEITDLKTKIQKLTT